MSNAPFGIIEQPGRSRLLLLCDHASWAVPASLHHLGLDVRILSSHHGWDIGALDVASQLSGRLAAPLIYTRCSRLVIDCNRPLGHRDLIRSSMNGDIIPGNQHLSDEERRNRIRSYFDPYHQAVTAHLQGQLEVSPGVLTAAIHSFTPALGGMLRPWHIGITYHQRTPFIDCLFDYMGTSSDLVVGDNLPYPVTNEGDFTLPHHCSSSQTPSVLVEMRQDLLSSAASRRRISRLIGDALYYALNRADLQGWWKS